MRSNIITSFGVLASVAAAAPAPEHQARATAPWVATNAAAYIQDGIVPRGVEFDLSVPAGNIPGSPAFDVHCIAVYGFSTGPILEFFNCTWNGGSQPPKYSAVLAETDGSGQSVTVLHQFLAADGLGTQISAVAKLPAKPDFNVKYGTLDFQVSSSVTRLPGLLGHFGTWTGTNTTPVKDSTGKEIGFQYKLSAPAGYTLDAPGFDVLCTYTYNSANFLALATCKPSGTVAEGSQVSLWAGLYYDYTVVYHQWTAANGTKYQLMGSSPERPEYKTVPTFTIQPNILYQL
ncbi:hypothetical protein FHL15_003762 [Xylaria flabelliformis]|uniref:Ubiquitin 3 binding protein But2 C-terminal domain-containing protein n=1 Tax=Xylaria flabelliformis TaxID=2512241 RepID=A0A553I5F1_9PEZI|nr:hypothetical protein FHL15_003762 [Xylaria flabelliformis]